MVYWKEWNIQDRPGGAPGAPDSPVLLVLSGTVSVVYGESVHRYGELLTPYLYSPNVKDISGSAK